MVWWFIIWGAPICCCTKGLSTCRFSSNALLYGHKYLWLQVVIFFGYALFLKWWAVNATQSREFQASVGALDLVRVDNCIQWLKSMELSRIGVNRPCFFMKWLKRSPACYRSVQSCTRDWSLSTMCLLCLVSRFWTVLFDYLNITLK